MHGSYLENANSKKQRPSSLNKTWITASCAPRGYQYPEAWKSPTEMLPGPHGPCRASRTEGRSFASGLCIACLLSEASEKMGEGVIVRSIRGDTRGSIPSFCASQRQDDVFDDVFTMFTPGPLAAS